MGCFDVFVYGRLLVTLYATAAAILSICDAYNVYTVKIKSWLIIEVIGLALSAPLLACWIVASYQQAQAIQIALNVPKQAPSKGVGSSKSTTYYPVNANYKARDSPPVNSGQPSDAGRMLPTYGITSTFIPAYRNVAHLLAQLGFALLATLVYAHGALQAGALYDYLGSSRSMFDDEGIPTGVPASYSVDKKLFLLCWIQIGWVLCLVTAVVGCTLSKLVGPFVALENQQ